MRPDLILVARRSRRATLEKEVTSYVTRHKGDPWRHQKARAFFPIEINKIYISKHKNIYLVVIEKCVPVKKHIHKNKTPVKLHKDSYLLIKLNSYIIAT